MNRFCSLERMAGEPAREALRQRILMLELAPVLVRDPEDRIVYWNRAAEIMYGFLKEEALGRCSRELLRTSFPESLDDILGRLERGREWRGELERVRSSGEPLTVLSHWVAHTTERGELLAIIEINNDITERKRAEAGLARTTARLDGILASAMDAIISVDAEQRIILFNPAAERMFGVPVSSALGQELGRFIPDRFRLAHAHHVEHFGESGVSTRPMGAVGTVSGLRANGEEFPIEASISQVTVGGEHILTVILRDVTERQRTEVELHQAMARLAATKEELEVRFRERTAELRRSAGDLQAFAYSLSHDLRAPVRAIESFSHIVLMDYAQHLGPEGIELLERVRRAACRLDLLIQDILTLSHLAQRTITLRAVDLDTLVRRTILGRAEFCAVGIEVEGRLLPVLGQEDYLTQCLVNLLSNAVRFVAPGVLPRVRVRSEAAGARVRLWVEDNGIGIPQKAQSKIFGLFNRLHPGQQCEGNGVGLAIVRTAVERMGGQVGVESALGQGSRFWLELRRSEQG